MKLPFSLFKKEESAEYFLSLLLRDEKASAFVFKQELGKLRLIGRGEAKLETVPEQIDEKQLITVVDKIISAAESNLPSNVETQKTVFGLKESWITDGTIKKEYLGRLKILCDTLRLDPIGYLTISEAIIHVLQKEEGAPVSAILVEAGRKNVAVSLVRASKIIESQKASLINSLPATVEHILKQVTSMEVLPARIILFDASSLEKEQTNEDITQEFIGFAWNKSLPFLHIPQVQVLPSEFDAHALLVGTATQMGFDVLNSEVPLPEKLEEQEEVEKPTFASSPSLEAFGFVKNQDITKIPETEQTITIEEPVIEPQHAPIQYENIQQIDDEELEPNHVPGKRSLQDYKTEATHFLTKQLHSFKKNAAHVKLPAFGSFTVPKGRGVLFGIIPIALIMGVILLYIFALKATVTLSIKPKVLSASQNFTITSTEATDFSSNILGGEVKSTEVEGNITTDTTGKKELGEKSKGEVVIYNSDLTESKSFQKGTKIQAPSDLEFVLDEDIKISSASGDASSIKSSTAKVNVTAAQIGKEYNMPSNTKFTIAGLSASLVIGKNDSAFSGGSKKEVSAVSQKDLDKALADLTKEVEPKANEELKKAIGKDESLISNLLNVTISKKSYNKKLNDEATKVTLTATISYEGIAYKTTDLEKYARDVLEKKIPSDFTISKDSLKTEVKNMKKDEDDFTATLNVKTLLAPKIETAKLIDEIKGKSFEDAETKLSSIRDTSVDIELIPNFSFLPKMLPFRPENIHIVQEVNE